MNKLTMKKAREIARKVCGSSKVEKADGEYIVTLGEIVVRMKDRCTDFQNRPLVEVYVGAMANRSVYLAFWVDTLERCYEAETLQWRNAMEEQRQDIIQQLQERGLMKDA